ncbi:MAG: thiamine phosphate synthase [Clostridia bacterium]|nr:thiamine phosphate synthase [Clostridia bacterium]
MKLSKDAMLVYAVTDRAWTGKMTLMEQVEAALKNGATCVQLREKELDEETFLAEAIEMAKLCKHYNVPFIVNDNVDIAIKSNADGIHVGQEDMAAMDVRAKVGPNMIIGVSAHNVEEAVEAVKNGADYLGIGACFTTSTKTDVSTMPISLLKEITDAVDIPTCGIGGISLKNIDQLKGSGIDGVAVVSAIFAAEDPGVATAELLELSKKTFR